MAPGASRRYRASSSGNRIGTRASPSGAAPGVIPLNRYRHRKRRRAALPGTIAVTPAPGITPRAAPPLSLPPPRCLPAAPPPIRPRPATVPRQRRQHRTRHGRRRRRDPAGPPPALEPSPRRGRAVQPRPPVSARCVPPPPVPVAAAEPLSPCRAPSQPERPPEPWPRSWVSPKKESVHRIQGRIGTAPGQRDGGTAACHGWGGAAIGHAAGAAGHGRGGGGEGGRLCPHHAELPPPRPLPAECPHSAATNGGYSRKENGGFFCP